MTTTPDRDRESDGTRRWAKRGDAMCAEAVVGKLVADHPLPRIGRFEAIARIGAGGHGIVFRARDPVLDRLVALKLCLASSGRATQRSMGEAKVLAKLKHPNIVTVYELGWHGDDVFIAMEYVEGSNVSAFAAREPSSAAVIDVFRGVGRGLAAAHEIGIVHGDVKPSNVLLDRDDFPRIADFGLAKLHEPEQVADPGKHVPSGTWVFMAPEVLRGQPSSVRSDQWSFCVSMLETLTNEPVFAGRTPRRILRQITRERIEAKLAHERVPAAVREVLRVGLSIEPSERYPSMRALVDELDGVRAVGVVELMPSKPKHGGFAVSLVIGLVCTMIGWVGRGQLAAPRVNEPISVPASSPCALEAGEPIPSAESVLIVTCSRIRAGKLREASKLWDVEFFNRRYPEAAEPTDEDLALLREETRIVARTFADQAERFHRWADDRAAVAKKLSDRWANQVEGMDLDSVLQPGLLR